MGSFRVFNGRLFFGAGGVYRDAAFGLASVALDFLVDDELAQAARADFEASGGAVDVEGYFSDM